jgi:hypothetical protein
MSNSISQSKMNTEPKVVSTQTTISSTTVTAEVKPQQVQAQTPDHKMYVSEIRKELAEASTTTGWQGNGSLLVSFGYKNVKQNVQSKAISKLITFKTFFFSLLRMTTKPQQI